MLTRPRGAAALAVPLGLGDDGQPISLQVISRRDQDRLVLAVAERLEEVIA